MPLYEHSPVLFLGLDSKNYWEAAIFWLNDVMCIIRVFKFIIFLTIVQYNTNAYLAYIYEKLYTLIQRAYIAYINGIQKITLLFIFSFISGEVILTSFMKSKVGSCQKTEVIKICLNPQIHQRFNINEVYISLTSPTVDSKKNCYMDCHNIHYDYVIMIIKLFHET